VPRRPDRGGLFNAISDEPPDGAGPSPTAGRREIPCAAHRRGGGVPTRSTRPRYGTPCWFYAVLPTACSRSRRGGRDNGAHQLLWSAAATPRPGAYQVAKLFGVADCGHPRRYPPMPSASFDMARENRHLLHWSKAGGARPPDSMSLLSGSALGPVPKLVRTWSWSVDGQREFPPGARDGSRAAAIHPGLCGGGATARPRVRGMGLSEHRGAATEPITEIGQDPPGTPKTVEAIGLERACRPSYQWSITCSLVRNRPDAVGAPDSGLASRRRCPHDRSRIVAFRRGSTTRSRLISRRDGGCRCPAPARAHQHLRAPPEVPQGDSLVLLRRADAVVM